jgi:hypothetical protein
MESSNSRDDFCLFGRQRGIDGVGMKPGRSYVV